MIWVYSVLPTATRTGYLATWICRCWPAVRRLSKSVRPAAVLTFTQVFPVALICKVLEAAACWPLAGVAAEAGAEAVTLAAAGAEAVVRTGVDAGRAAMAAEALGVGAG